MRTERLIATTGARKSRSRLGPLPRGDYDILNRIQGGNPNLDGVPAWALDRKDSVPRDDIAQGYRRGAFRFHFGSSEGCVTTNDWNGFKIAVDILTHTATQTVTMDASGQSRVYYGDFHVFSGVGTCSSHLSMRLFSRYDRALSLLFAGVLRAEPPDAQKGRLDLGNGFANRYVVIPYDIKEYRDKKGSIGPSIRH